ncbi:glycosyltransferase [Saliphagus infecundisoli]|uniref:Glycosyltransferase n=1 Tax=Saliphagus infecundisoli TaxID=1849069 RepID=A0ABD5QFP8_9EURY|nr:glycosyltransferase [Saliphagus infecundisoli]
MGHVAVFLTSMGIGGAQRVAFNLCSGLVQNGHTVDLVLVSAEGDLLEELPPEISVVGLDASRVTTSALPLRRYLRAREPDVLYAMMTEINVAAVAAHRLAGVGTRLVVSEHNMPSASADGIKDRLALRLAALAYPYADRTVAVSRGVREDLRRVVGVEATVIHNPVDVERIRRRAGEPMDHDWFADPSLSVVTSAGRHVPQKGFDTLLRAFAALADDDARLVLLGEGEQRAALRRLADDLAVGERVAFPGFVDNPFKYMGRADAFVLSSWYEGFGNVLIEAMACGTPVVSTDCPSGPSEILENGTYGPLVPVKDPDRMAGAIDEVLSDPPDSEALSMRADEFSIPVVTAAYEDVFFGEE